MCQWVWTLYRSPAPQGMDAVHPPSSELLPPCPPLPISLPSSPLPSGPLVKSPPTHLSPPPSGVSQRLALPGALRGGPRVRMGGQRVPAVWRHARQEGRADTHPVCASTAGKRGGGGMPNKRDVLTPTLCVPQLRVREGESAPHFRSDSEDISASPTSPPLLPPLLPFPGGASCLRGHAQPGSDREWRCVDVGRTVGRLLPQG